MRRSTVALRLLLLAAVGLTLWSLLAAKQDSARIDVAIQELDSLMKEKPMSTTWKTAQGMTTHTTPRANDEEPIGTWTQRHLDEVIAAQLIMPKID